MARLSEAGEPPTTAELRIAQAQLVGWLDGPFQGIRATLASQHLEHHEQLEQMYLEALRSAGELEQRRASRTYL